ncbi:MAG: L,D-transpeptidase [Chloroflexi bacterium]|nr:L,D-transpeptidase [Chloroflexota bacterium]
MVLRAISLLLLLCALLAALPAQALNVIGPCAGYNPDEGVDPSQECLDYMLAHPLPWVAQVELDGVTLSNFSYWRVGPDAVNLYDAPGGAVVGQIGAGFNFVNAIDTSVEGWLQIQGGQWIQGSDARWYEPSRFRGVLLLDNLEHPFAWILGDLVTVPAPGARQSLETGRFLPRYTMVNLYAEYQAEDGWYWYMVGPNEWVEQRNMSIAHTVERPEGVEGRWIAVDLYEQNMVAYENDTPVFATLVATGLPGTDTNEGLFTIWARVANDTMSGFAGAPNSYALQSVPWVMYFDDAISLHGTYWHDLFGFRRSRGCVNLTISDAHWLYDWAGRGEPNADGEIVTHVYVYASGDYHGDGPQTK